MVQPRVGEGIDIYIVVLVDFLFGIIIHLIKILILIYKIINYISHKSNPNKIYDNLKKFEDNNLNMNRV
jgi:hypothetical protein